MDEMIRRKPFFVALISIVGIELRALHLLGSVLPAIPPAQETNFKVCIPIKFSLEIKPSIASFSYSSKRYRIQ
jgi:hypothetical protein